MGNLARLVDDAGDAVRKLKFDRVSQKIDEAYESGDFSRAARWDERLERWLDNRENYSAGIISDGPEISGGYFIDDEGTGVSQKMAAAYEDYIRYPDSFASQEDFAENLRRIAEDGTGSWPTPKSPPDEDVISLAREILGGRQALRAKYLERAQRRPKSIDVLIGRLGENR